MFCASQLYREVCKLGIEQECREAPTSKADPRPKDRVILEDWESVVWQ